MCDATDPAQLPYPPRARARRPRHGRAPARGSLRPRARPRHHVRALCRQAAGRLRSGRVGAPLDCGGRGSHASARSRSSTPTLASASCAGSWWCRRRAAPASAGACSMRRSPTPGSAGCPRLPWSFATLTDALRLYERAGFKTTETKTSFIWGAERAEVRMDLELRSLNQARRLIPALVTGSQCRRASAEACSAWRYAGAQGPG